MLIIRCTQRLLKRFKGPSQTDAKPSTTVLGDWYADLIHTKPQHLVICINESTLLVCLVPAKDTSTFPDRFRDAAAAHLKRLGIPAIAIDAEVRAMADIKIARTVNRRVVGCMNIAKDALLYEAENKQYNSLTQLEDFFDEYLYSVNHYRRPKELVLERFAKVRVSN